MYRQDDEDDAKAQLLHQQRVLKTHERDKQRSLIEASMAVDKKWQSQESRSQDLRTKNVVDFALLKNLPEYNASNRVSARREDPLSWRLNMFVPPPTNDSTTLPSTVSASASVENGFNLVGSRSYSTTEASIPKVHKGSEYTGGGDLPVHALASSKVFIIINNLFMLR